MAGKSTYTEEIGDSICERIGKGESLLKILEAPGMPDYSTVLKWLRDNEAFSLNYVQARQDQADFYAQEITDIADEDIDFSNLKDKKIANALVQKQRLRIDARKWVAAKLKPKKYGDRMGLDVDATVTLEDKLKQLHKDK